MWNAVGDLAGSTLRLLSLVGVLAHTRRALRAWIRERHATLLDVGFLGQRSVTERRMYVELGTGDLVARAVGAPGGDRQRFVWITGPGGSGKSTLAFEIARRASSVNDVVAVIVDFGWRGPLDEYVAATLSLAATEERVSAGLARRLLRAGLVWIVVDGLSEIQRLNAVEDVLDAYRRGDVRHLIVTSRQRNPIEDLGEEVVLLALDEHQLKRFVDGYVSSRERQERVLGVLRRFAVGRAMSPLLARLAIAHISDNGVAPASSLALIQAYLSSLRSIAASAPAEGDYLRACRLAAFACLERTFSPHDLSQEYLRGVLDGEAGRSPFYANDGGKLSTQAIMAQLEECGLLQGRVLNAAYRYDFVYHPVAEYLAAAHVGSLPTDGRDKVLSEIRGAGLPSRTFVGALHEVGIELEKAQDPA